LFVITHIFQLYLVRFIFSIIVEGFEVSLELGLLPFFADIS